MGALKGWYVCAQISMFTVEKVLACIQEENITEGTMVSWVSQLRNSVTFLVQTYQIF